MEECELLKGCLFFNDKMDIEAGLGAMFKARYCKGNFQKCARYIVAKAQGRDKVPANLYPNMLEQAQKLAAVR